MMHLEYRDGKKWSLIDALDEYRLRKFVRVQEDGK